jgi:hypothetical protein
MAQRVTQAWSVKGVAIHRDDMVADAPGKRLWLCITSRRPQGREQGKQVLVALAGLLSGCSMAVMA